MLDDLKLIHERDAQDALGVAQKQYEQLFHTFNLPSMDGPFENIVFAGMGGSALGALLSTTWPGHRIPFEISRGYTIPGYVAPSTLFIASSYSGNTEETLEALRHAEERGARVAVITSGGTLAQIAGEKNYPRAIMPGGLQPRYTALFTLKALCTLLGQAGLLDGAAALAELEQAGNFLKGHLASWAPTEPTAANPPKALALELAGKSPVIYGGPLTYPAAYKWKISFNENAKNVAWCNQYPEFNHNEFLGWTSHPIDKPYAVVELRSSFEHTRVQKRFEVTERMLSGMRPAPHVVKAEGDTILEQLLYLLGHGDFTSLYLALLNGLNPTPVDLIERFKKALDE